MIKVQKRWLALAAAWSLVAGAAEPESLVVGVFLPVSVAEGQERLAIAERLAARLQESLGVPVSGRSFGRFQDFSEALSSGEITLGLVDGWVAGGLPAGTDPLAVGTLSADRQRLSLVTRGTKTIPQLKGSPLAIVRGASGQEAKLVSNVFFAGDLQAHKHFKLVSVPNAESALEALQTGAAEAALVSAGTATGLTVVYPGPVQSVLAVKGKKAVPSGMREALLKLSLAPISRFAPAQGDEVAQLRGLLQRGPPPRTPLMVESSPERFDPALIDTPRLALELPPLAGTVVLPETSPDD